MPNDLDAEVAGLKRRIAEASARRAKAAAAAEAQRLLAAEAAGTLLREFGVGPEEVQQAIAAKEADLAAEVKRVREALERAEASE